MSPSENLPQLFKHISLVIHTSLLNLEHDVMNLSDIIPRPSERLRNSVADIITKGQGRGVCFLIDDCSEAVLKMIKLPQCMFLVTSGPHLNNIPHNEIALKVCKSVLKDYFTTMWKGKRGFSTYWSISQSYVLYVNYHLMDLHPRDVEWRWHACHSYRSL